MSLCRKCGKEIQETTAADVVCAECREREDQLLKFKETVYEREVGGNVGWVCPVCGRGNAPWAAVCSCR